MAANFKISVHRNRDSLELKLMGDFDGTSACELLNLIKEKSAGVHRVFIHTDGLKDICPFGQDTFQNNLYTLKDKPIRFEFTGRETTILKREPHHGKENLGSCGRLRTFGTGGQIRG